MQIVAWRDYDKWQEISEYRYLSQRKPVNRLLIPDCYIFLLRSCVFFTPSVWIIKPFANDSCFVCRKAILS